MGARVRLTIDSIAAGGDGVGRLEGLVVFVPRSAPGDVGEVELVSRGRFARGSLRTLVEPSPDRVEPPCRHYTDDRCGGCQIQHLRYEAQRLAKAGIIRDAVQRIAHRPAVAPDVRASAREWRYRRKLTLAMRRRGGRTIAGLHPYDDPRDVFDLSDCPITDERVIGIWRAIRSRARWLPDAPELRGAVQLLDERASFTVEGGRAWAEPARLLDEIPELTSIWWRPEGGSRRRVAARAADDRPSASFAQVNESVAAALRMHAVARVLAHAPRTVVDAYAGIGDTAVSLAAHDVAVTAIELDPDAAAWCGARLPAGSRAIAARVEEALPAALPADVVVLNPPRTGVDERVTATLSAAEPAPRAIVYVSCNPGTLARDLARLPGFRIASLVAFDMFPQTAHVETVCELVPEAA